MAKKKDFAAMDKRSGDGAATDALKRRFDDSRVTVFDAAVTDLAANPSNPRDADDPTVQETKGSLETVGQLQEIRVVTRQAYLEAYPDNEDALEPGKWVVVMGNRRLLAARLAALASLSAKLCPDVATAQDVEDRIIHENVHRLDLDPLYEADLYRRKMERDGISARELAEAISKTHSYVNQRLALLKLIPEFQERIRAGALGLKDSRALSKLPEERQRELWTAGPPYTAQPAASGNPVSSHDRPPEQGGGQTHTPHHAESDGALTEPHGQPTHSESPHQDNTPSSSPLPPASSTSPSNGHAQPVPITITGTSPVELAQALRSKLDGAGIAELVALLRADR